MRRAIAFVLTLSFLATTAGAQAHRLDQLAWFTGCWERANGERRTVERWEAATGDAMKGDSRSFNGSNETAGERLRVLLEDGRLVYAAQPSTQLPQRFTATTITATGVTFENPAHDFPQRIIYEKRGSDSLVARIEGDRAGRRQPVTFAFRRIGCDGLGEAPVNEAEAALAPLYADLEKRLLEHPGAAPAWFVEHAAPGFLYVSFGGAGYMARTGSLSTQEAAARAMRPPSPDTFTNVVATVTLGPALVIGDTAQVMVVSRQQVRSGPAGQQRLRATEQRRLDRWVRIGGAWKLLAATVVDDETYIDGVLTAKNGTPVPN